MTMPLWRMESESLKIQGEIQRIDEEILKMRPGHCRIDKENYRENLRAELEDLLLKIAEAEQEKGE